MTMTAATEDRTSLRITAPRWTHVAVPVADLDRSIAFYTDLTPLVFVARNQDASGQSAWLSNPHQVDSPFVLVLVQLKAHVGAQFGIEEGKPQHTLGPFSHFGVELPNREDVDAIAERARAMDALQMPPMQMADHVGYICMVTDPDGNTIEFSHNQRVYETIRRMWGAGGDAPAR